MVAKYGFPRPSPFCISVHLACASAPDALFLVTVYVLFWGK